MRQLNIRFANHLIKVKIGIEYRKVNSVSIKKLERNKQMIKFAKDNPTLGLRQISESFKLSRATAYHILKSEVK